MTGLQIDNLQIVLLTVNGGLIVAVRWLWYRLDKCERRHDLIDQAKRNRFRKRK